MNNKIRSEDQFSVLRKIKKDPSSSQREMAKDLGFSLGNQITALNHYKKKDL